MERHGADKYPSAFVQKTFKELDAAGQTAITPANGTANDNDDAASTCDADEDVAMKEEEEKSGDDGGDDA